jgi:hypothetical protein
MRILSALAAAVTLWLTVPPATLVSSEKIISRQSVAGTQTAPTGFVIRVPQDAATIQVGINIASSGDTILISEGNYFENINFRGKQLVVTSLTIHDGDTSHIRHTVIDGSTPADPDTGSVVSFVSQEDSNAVLYGLTLQHGSGTRFESIFPPFMTGARVGGGIFAYESGPRILHCVIQDNAVSGDTAVGAGMYALAYNRKPHIVVDGCVIRRNSADAVLQAWGGGASMHGMRGRIAGSVIERNALSSHGTSLGGGLDLWRYRADTVIVGMVIEGNTILGNRSVAYDGAWGGGIISTEGSYLIVGNTVDSNLVRDTVSGSYSGGIHIEDGGLTGPIVIARQNRLRGNVVESNVAAFGGGMVIHTDDAILTGDEFLGNILSAPDAFGTSLARLFGTPATVVESSLFLGNSVQGGVGRGTIYLSRSQGIMFSRLRIENNAGTDGGGLHLRESGFRVENSLILHNGATNGGGIYVAGVPTTTGEEPGRADRTALSARAGLTGSRERRLLPPPDRQEIVNCTITSNAAVAYGGGFYTSNAAPILMNCILWNDTAGSGGGEIHLAGGDIQVRYSDVRLGWPGSGNMDVDPRLIGDQGHVDTASQCIGRGIDTMVILGDWYYAPLTDRDGGIRPNPPGTLPDIGSFESPLSLPGGVLRSYPVSRGWGIVSVPLTLSDYQKSVVFPTASSEAWAYQGAYVQRTMLANRIAYWLKFDSAHTVSMTGLIRSLDTIRVDSGWNLIGSISTPVDTGNVTKIPSDLLRSSFFGYSRSGYRIVGAIEPMNGYWVRASVPGILVLSSAVPPAISGASSWSEFGSILVTDATGAEQRLYFSSGIDPSPYEMPPPPPAGVLDVRFTSGSLLASTNQEILIAGGTYPVQVRMEKALDTRALLVVEDEKPAGVGDVLMLRSPGSRVSLRFTNPVSAPASFQLHANYPNPFNPSTTILYALPSRVQVTMKIFDVLGQQVATLVDEIQEPGYHSVEWNAAGVASGTYLCQFQAGAFARVGRMLLVK